MSSDGANQPTIYIDADACPVKEEVYRVAGRHAITVYVVSGQGVRTPREAWIRPVMVGDAFDAADDWIADAVTAGDIVITADIALAKRALEKAAGVLSPTGHRFTDANIGVAMAMRDLKSDLRAMGDPGHNPSFSKRDRSVFLQELERLVQRHKRG